MTTNTVNKFSRDTAIATLATAGWQAKTINARGAAVLASVRRLDGAANAQYESRLFVAADLRNGRVVECRGEIGTGKHGQPVVRIVPMK